MLNIGIHFIRMGPQGAALPQKTLPFFGKPRKKTKKLYRFTFIKVSFRSFPQRIIFFICILSIRTKKERLAYVPSFNHIYCIMKNLCSLSPEELVFLSNALSVKLSEGKTADEIFVLRNIFSQVSQTLFSLASQKQFLDKCKKNGG